MRFAWTLSGSLKRSGSGSRIGGIAQALLTLLMPCPLFIGSSRTPLLRILCLRQLPLCLPWTAASGLLILFLVRALTLSLSHSLFLSLIQLRQLRRYFLCKLHIVDICLIQFKSIPVRPKSPGKALETI